jgi:hypothetical protein
MEVEGSGMGSNPLLASFDRERNCNFLKPWSEKFGDKETNTVVVGAFP